MLNIDDSDGSILSLDVKRHARIIGAPGSGKTTLLVESVKRIVSSGTLKFDEILILTNSRNTSSVLRTKIEASVESVISGVLVRTPESYAFATLAQANAEKGVSSPRLLTGVAHDEILRQTIENILPELIRSTGLSQQIIQSRAFRDELRDLERIVNDYSLKENNINKEPNQTVLTNFKNKIISFVQEADFERDNAHLLNVWQAAMQVLLNATTSVAQDSVAQDSGAQTSSELLAAAWKKLNDPEQVSQINIPKLVLVDDAGDLTRGAANLLAALANRGATIWAFGDPDTATGAFQGLNTRLLQSIEHQLMQTGILRERHRLPEQELFLSKVYRHGSQIRDLVKSITKRIGTQGLGTQRDAVATDDGADSVEFAKVNSESEQTGIIAHRLRAAKYGALNNLGRISWSNMAVLCRSQLEVDRTRSLLAHYEVPTKIGSGGIVLREHRIVRDLILMLLFVSSEIELTAEQLNSLLTGQIGKFDTVSLRRLKQDLTLRERRLAIVEDRVVRKYEDYVFDFLLEKEAEETSSEEPFVKVSHKFKSKELQKFETFASLIKSGLESHKSGSSTLETLWLLWNSSRLSNQLQKDALASGLMKSARANEQLDAVMSLFYVLQRHEEQADPTPVTEILSDLLTSDLAQDTLADQALNDSVLITTVQGAIGTEFDLVCVVGPQEGIWPNMRSRGSILQLATLENLLTDGIDLAHDRTNTMHDELRLFAAAVSRSKHQVLAVAVQSEEQFPSVFYTLGKKFEVEGLPHNRFSLRGFVAEMRGQLEVDAKNQKALKTLAFLSQNDIEGASPSDWYGTLKRSTEAPLIELSESSEELIPVSPSKITMVEECSLNWAIENLGGGPSELSARLGTLIHKALEISDSGSFDELISVVEEGWAELEFDSLWQEARQKEQSKQMIRGLVDYLKDTAQNQKLLLKESFFEVKINQALLRGVVDRIEIRTTEEDLEVPIVVDLKTISTTPTVASVGDDPQLQAYQSGLLIGKFKSKTQDDEAEHEFSTSGGAQLLYVHPKVQNKGKTYRTYDQAAMTLEELEAFKERVKEVATIMASGTFEANIEHHCQSARYRVACALHIIPPVSNL